MSPTFPVRRSCKILGGMVIAATLSEFAIPYIGGRVGSPLWVGILPAQLAPAFLNLGSIAALSVIGVVALFHGRNRRFAISTLILSLVVVASGFSVAPARLFQVGFRHRIKSTMSSAELREIAQACSTTLPPESTLPGPKKWSLWNETEHRPMWTALTKMTALRKLDSSLVIFHSPDAVEIGWGGALVGHWGVIIQKSGAGDGDIAPGIQTFIRD